MHSSGSVELDVQIIFDEVTKDIDTLLNLRFDIVDELHIPDVDCLISLQDIHDASLLVRVPNFSGVPKDLSDSTGARADLSATLDQAEPRRYYTCAITRSKTALTRMHISEFFDFEQEDMGEPEKEDSLDAALQEKTTAEAKVPKPSSLIEGPVSLQIALKVFVAP